MDYQRVQIESDSETAQVLMAFLGEMPFEMFEEVENGLDAYIPSCHFSSSIKKEITALQEKFDFKWSDELIVSQNWNQTWEDNFQPIILDDFCAVRADFHQEIPSVRYEILINPKMAFGTGHHETTRMMLRAMKDINFNQKKVLDYGCGTGVLAILADKMGATQIEAVDIEAPSFENTVDNFEINGVKDAVVFLGTLDEISSNDFDIILANINRNVILNSLSPLKSKLKQNGKLLISGFLLEDEKRMLEAVTSSGFSVKYRLNEGAWLCMVLEIN